MKKKHAKKVKKAKGVKKSRRAYVAFAGGLIGAALGVGAGLLAESKLGKKAGHLPADFYRYMAPQIKKVKRVGEAEYKKFVAEATKRYGKDKKLSQAEANHLAKEAQASWKHLKKHL